MSIKESKIEEVVKILNHRIADGTYVAGQKLPGERDLGIELQVSRVTIRNALNRLQAENLIDILPRAGAIVRAPNARITIGSAIAPGQELKAYGSFINAMQAQGLTTLVKFLEPSSIKPAGQLISEKLHISPETEVLRRYRLHITNGRPYRILDSYYLASIAGGLIGQDDGYTPLFRWIREHANKIAGKAMERLQIRMPNASEAHLLAIARNQPVVDMDRWVWAKDGILFEYSHIIANAALHEYTYSYEIDEEASK